MFSQTHINPMMYQSEVARNIHIGWGWFMSLGVMLMALGAVAIAVPAMATLAVELLIGWILILGAIMHVVDAFWIHHWRESIFQILLGALYLIIGVMLLTYPLRGAITLTLLLAIFFVVGGLFKIILAIQMRTIVNWGWLLLSGILGLILGALIWSNLPSSAGWAIGLLLGIDLVFTGWSIMIIALAAHRALESART
jgi:uncharacterized membrane protein HdeD (DUF308 family)